jgi:hypothetical protein
MNPHNAPPKLTLTLRVGVTGHRPNKLDDAAAAVLEPHIEATLKRVHEQLSLLRLKNADVYAGATPCVRIISALAEGADRLVVSAALRQHCEIMAVLPFPRDSYIRDFVRHASKEEFSALLARASTIMEFDGQYDPPEARNAGYASVGMSVVQHVDLLVAIWDGGDARGQGGTAEIIDYAIHNDRPVIWFPSEGMSPKYYGELMRLLLPDRSVVVGAEEELMPWLTRLLVPPSDQTVIRSLFMTKRDLVSAASSVKRYFSESRPRWPLYRFFDWFHRLMTITRHADTNIPPAAAIAEETASPAKSYRPDAISPDDYVVRIVQEWNDQLASATGTRFHDSKLEFLAEHYAWLDQLADYYAGSYRSTFLINYLLAAGAVMAAAANLARAGSGVELFILLSVISLTIWGMTRGWHRRWIEYRELAEKLRTIRYLRIVASPPVAPLLPPHFVQPNDAVAQTSWLYRAIVRECGLPSIAFTKEYRERVRKYLIKYEISDQIDYHHRNSEDLHVFDRRLHLLSISAFVLACAGAFVHVSLGRFALSLLPTISYLSIVLPAVGAAFFGIRNHGEFLRVSERSQRMEAALKAIRDELEQSAGAISDRQTLESKAQIIARTMLSETSDWQNLVLARPLELPA